MTDKYSEQIIDSFLQELLGKQSPPDLSGRIAAAWERQQAAAPAAREPLVKAVPVTPPAIVPGQMAHAQPAPGQMAPAQMVSRPALRHALPRRTPPADFRRNVAAALLALTACGLLALLGSQLYLTQQTSPTLDAPQAAAPGTRPTEDLADASRPQDGLATLQESPNDRSPSPPVNELVGSQTLETEDVPFALDRPLAPGAGAAVDAASRETLADAGPLLADAQIVQNIDQRLSQVWQMLGITATPVLADQPRAEHLSQLLTGQPAAVEMQHVQRYVGRLTAGPLFDQRWAEKLVQEWFAGGSLPLDDPRVVETQQQIARLLSEGRGFNRLAVQLLGGQMPDSLKAASQTPGDPMTTAYVSSLAGNGNHRLVAHIGADFLDANVTCVRCHDSPGTSPASTNRDGTAGALLQDDYWSLVSLWQGIEMQGGTGRGRIAVDQQPQLLAQGKPFLVYYDLLDGRLQAAQPRLPDGRAWEQAAVLPSAGSPRQAFAQWVSQSSAFDQAMVNLAWKLVFGRPLVVQQAWHFPQAQERAADDHRRALQSLLAEQYRRHGHNWKQLVGWLASSQAAARQAWEPERSQWLEASDSQVRQWQLAMENFASGPVASPPAATPLETAVASLIKWHAQAAPTSANASAATLAQPDLNVGNKGKQRRAALPSTMVDIGPGLRYAMYAEQPSLSDVALITRLLASQRLSWQQRVEHVVLLNPHNAAGPRIKHLADQLLQQHNGDDRAALLDLLWAVRHAGAG